MIDFDPATACRICLEDGGTYPIFESNENFESILAKLTQCLKEKIEDIEGFPRNICLECKNTAETISNFINKFEATNKILLSKVTVKMETLESLDFSDDDNVTEPLQYELQIQKIVNAEPKVEKSDPTELLGSLTHLTVKRIKVESDTVGHDSNCVENENVEKQKRSRSCKAKKAVPNKIKNGAQQQTSRGPSNATKSATGSATKKVVRQSRQEIKVDKNNEANVDAPKLCDQCGAKFDTVVGLSNHKKTVHSERKFKCTKCPKAYVYVKGLNEHVLKAHENVRNYTCDTCGKGFFMKKTLTSHILIVHKKVKKIRTAVYQCKYCDRSYTYKRGVVIHERSVHTGERPSVCSECGSSFYDHVYLAEHMRIHTGDNPFKCPVCGRGYTQRGNMKSHMRNHKISELDADTLSKLKPNYFKFMRP